MRFLNVFAFTLSVLLVFSGCNNDDDPEPFKGPLTLGPTANFHITNQGGGSFVAPSTITFFNQSSNSTSYIWDFGDGTPVSTAATATVTHTYTTGGTFTVTLTAKGAEGSTATKALDIVVLPTPTQVLTITAKPYKLTGYTFSNSGGPVQDIFSNIDPCHHDDLFVFKTGQILEVEEGAANCPQFETWAGQGHWGYSSDFSYISLQSANFFLQGEVLSLDANTLKISHNSGGQIYTYTFTAQP